MALKDIITLTFSCLALLGTSINIYLQYFHKPNSLLASVDDISISRPEYQIPPDKVTFITQLTLTFINNGKTNIAVTDVKAIFSPNEKLDPGALIKDNNLTFSLEPGAVKIQKVIFKPSCELDFQAGNYTICGPDTMKFREHYIGLDFVIITDNGKRIKSKFNISKIDKLSIHGFMFDAHYKVFNLVTQKVLNHLPSK